MKKTTILLSTLLVLLVGCVEKNSATPPIKDSDIKSVEKKSIEKNTAQPKETPLANNQTNTQTGNFSIEYTSLTKEEDNTMREKLKAAIPGVPEISEIKFMPKYGLYEVVTKPVSIMYFNKDVTMVIVPQGGLIDVGARKPVLEASMSTIYPKFLKTFDYNNAIKDVKGDGSRKLIIFADVNCGYCKKLYSEIKTLTNVTVYTFLIDVLGSKDKAVDIWCSKDNNAALLAWFENGTAPEAASAECKAKNAIDANQKVAGELGIHGTPSMMFGSGVFIPSYIPLKTIEEELNKPEYK